jgi:superfamily II DNA or RNA helicase
MLLGYIYIRDNKWYMENNVYKVGITTSIKDRSNTYITGELYRGFYVKIYELRVNQSMLKTIDKNITDNFKKDYNIYFDGGTEFYNRKIINMIEPYLNELNIKFISKTEDELKRINRKYYSINNYFKLVSKLLMNDNDNDNENDNNKNEIILRDYQINAINYIISELRINNKIYLCLATGAGKSQIAFNVISEIKPLNIFIFSPRITIKKQNIDEKYLKILNNYDYNIYSYCYQSYRKVYELIINDNIKNIFIWFDEAHYTLDNWIIDNNNDIKQFFVNDTNYIKYRLFTTASPNKEFVITNKKIYGELYEPIRFKELMNLGYLAKIEVEIFDTEINKDDIEFNSLIFNTFNKKGQERKCGLSFHNSCKSAYLYYLHHLKSFQCGKINIKPYILINEEFIKNEETIEEAKEETKEDLNEIKKIKKKLGKDIIYYNDIKEFESDIGKNQNSIGYVVAKYSMGYDNKNIDIIYFTDYKLSYKDIIQSIGRGTRVNGNKYLRIILPTNSNNEVGKEYKKIENVLKYLLLDIELDYDKIKSFILTKTKPKINKNEDELKEIIEELEIEIIEDTNEKSNINTMKHDIIVRENQWTSTKIINQLKFNNIHNLEDYNIYKDLNKILNLPNINELLEYQNFNFRDTYINEEECPYYYNKYECIEIIKTYKKELRKINRDNKKLEYLVSVNNKIPNMSLWYFYGGKRDEYY